MRYLIEREGRVRFSTPVREHQVEVRLAPRDGEWQQVASCALQIEPAVGHANHRDGFGNLVHRFGVLGPHDRLIVRLRAEVETRLANPFDFTPVAPAEEMEWIAERLHQAPRLWDFLLHRSPSTPSLPETLDTARVPLLVPGLALLGQVQAAMAWIGEVFALDRASSRPEPQLATLLETGRGGAPELSHLLIALVRGWGVPARYVSGYVDPGYFDPDEEEAGAEALPQRMHAWTEVLIPGAGWRGFDPSTGLLADATYVGVAVGRDAGDVPCERAAFKGDAEEPAAMVNLNVTRVT